MLTIHLGQDENDCFAAWVSAKEAGINVTDDNLRGNYNIELMLFHTVVKKHNFCLLISKLWQSDVAITIRKLA